MTALQLNAEQYRAMGENRETEVRGFRFFEDHGVGSSDHFANF